LLFGKKAVIFVFLQVGKANNFYKMEYENSPLGLPRSVFKVYFLLELGNTESSMVLHEQRSEMDKYKI
jgi:hypothetical protein